MLCSARLVDALFCDRRYWLGAAIVAWSLTASASGASVLYDFDTLPDSAGCSQPVSSSDFTSALAYCDESYVTDNFGGSFLGTHTHTVDGLTLRLSALGYIDWRFGSINCGNVSDCSPGFVADFSRSLSSAKVDMVGVQDFSGSDSIGTAGDYFLRAYAGPGGTGALLDEATAPAVDCNPFAAGCPPPTILRVASEAPIGSLVFGASGELAFSGPIDNLGIADNLHVNPVPEPSSALVFGTALLAARRQVQSSRRRRLRASREPNRRR